MRIDDLILEADNTLFEAKDFDSKTIKDLNIEHETRMALKTIKGQAAERVAMYIRVGEATEYLISTITLSPVLNWVPLITFISPVNSLNVYSSDGLK